MEKLNLIKFRKLAGLSTGELRYAIDTGKIVPRRTPIGKPYFLLRDVEDFKNFKKTEVFPLGTKE